MTPEDVRQLISQGEGQKIEFKQSFAEQNRAIQSLCAFSNAQGGTVLFGVAPDGRIVGADVGRNTLENFANSVKASTEPPIYPCIEQVDVNDRLIVAATVEDAKPGQ